MSKFQIEKHHEVELKRRVADVRPWGQKMQEWLSVPSNFLFFAGPLAMTAVALPMTLPVVAPVFLAGYIASRSMKALLPYRYPAPKKVDPEGKKADGILCLGNVRSNSSFENFKQCWLSDDDMRKHWLIMGSTGSGKSETLKGIFFNALCWGSGFFCADGKADNKLPTDGYTMARAFARDDDILGLNFLLGGKTPQQVARSRRRRSNRLNPFSNGDADTLIQMGANLLPKAEGDGKSWQEKALAVWRAVITALCYKRDTTDYTLSVGSIIDHLSIQMIEELYVEGYKEAQESHDGAWSYGYVGIKNYLDSGCPAYSVEKLQKKHNLIETPAPTMPGRRPAPGREHEQDPAAIEQHGYRVGQLMPVLNLLDKTYGYIFRAPFSEIDMIDVALRNRILFLLIPSLEKSSQEAENLGKLAIACLRVMMARNLGSELEGTYEELLGSKATNSNYPYIAALDELGYYFADGIAVMFAQARSLGISMIAAAQDLEKLTEGSRAAEAGAMMGNTVNKIFMKNDDSGKTWDLISKTLGKIRVATYGRYISGEGMGGFKRERDMSVEEIDRVSYDELQKFKPGQAMINALGHTERVNTFFMGKWLEKLNNQKFHLNRFLQVHEPTEEDIQEFSVPLPTAKTEKSRGDRDKLESILKGEHAVPAASGRPVFTELARVTGILNEQMSGLGPIERGAVLYLSLCRLVERNAQMGKSIDAVEDEIPASAAILGSEEAIGLAQALDEHGLPDPLSLIRKPLGEILSAPGEEPIRRSVSTATDRAKAASASPTLDPLEFSDEDMDPTFDPVDQIIQQGRPTSAPGSSAAWVTKAIGQAHEMAESPRAADGSAVGLSDPTMHELAELEEELGSARPKSAAHAMQKVVSAQITPNTIGQGALSDDDISAFFEEQGLDIN